MNKRKIREQEEKEAERARMQQAILQHAESLTQEMNLRMFLEEKRTLWQLLEENDGKILFVESMTITDISYPSEKRKTGYLSRLKRKLRQWFG